MIDILNDSYPSLFVAVAPCIYTPAALLTLFRLYHRYKKRQLWWDDYAVATSLTFAIIFMATWPYNPVHFSREFILSTLSCLQIILQLTYLHLDEQVDGLSYGSGSHCARISSSFGWSHKWSLLEMSPHLVQSCTGRLVLVSACQSHDTVRWDQADSGAFMP